MDYAMSDKGIHEDDKSLIVEQSRSSYHKPRSKIRLSQKQAAFVFEYLKTNDLKQAVLNAGYVTKWPLEQAKTLLSSQLVQETIKKSTLRVNPDTLVTFEEITNVLKDHLMCGDREISIRAAAELNKMRGFYAPTKAINMNLDLTLEAFETLDIKIEDC